MCFFFSLSLSLSLFLVLFFFHNFLVLFSPVILSSLSSHVMVTALHRSMSLINLHLFHDACNIVSSTAVCSLSCVYRWFCLHSHALTLSLSRSLALSSSSSSFIYFFTHTHTLSLFFSLCKVMLQHFFSCSIGADKHSIRELWADPSSH